jgi:hypothetical protein
MCRDLEKTRLVAETMRNEPVLEDDAGNDLQPEHAIANINAWLERNASDQDADFWLRQRDWAERCIREGRVFRVVPSAVAVVVSVGGGTSHLKGCMPVPPDELLRNIEEWKLVWPDAPQKLMDRYEQMADDARQQLKQHAGV